MKKQTLDSMKWIFFLATLFLGTAAVAQIVNPYALIEAEDFDEQSGIQIVGNSNLAGVAYINDGDFIRFDNVDFANGPVSGGVRASSATNGGVIEFRTESTNGPLIATTTVTNTGDWRTPEIFPITMVDPTGYADGSEFLGTQTLYLVFTGGNGFLIALEKFRFNAAEVPVEEIQLTNCPVGDVTIGDQLIFEGQVVPEFPSISGALFSIDNGETIDPITGEYTAQNLGEVTVTLTSISNPNVFDQCTFTVMEPEEFRVVIFHKTNGFRHGSINAGIDMIEDFGLENDWIVEDSQNSNIFTDTNLATVDVVVWLNTSGNNLLTGTEQDAFENYIQNGGGFVGFHAATDTYRNQSWPWYNDLVGAIVQTGPNHTSNNFNATMDVVGSHPAVEHLGTEWNKDEEYYYWELNGGYIFDGNIDLLRVRSTGSQSYDVPRPITWYKEFDGGRSFYTALGHNSGDYNNDDDFRIMSEEAIRWAGGLIDIAPEGDFAEEIGGTHDSHDHGIVAYPNPANDLLNIRSEGEGIIEVALFSITGKLLKQTQGLSGLQLDVSDLDRGMYVLQGKQGELRSQVKIVKE
jgi:type 1 glutamine amidotransferase